MEPVELAAKMEPAIVAAELSPHDFVGSTFFIACNMMLAFTAFFFSQVGSMPQKWRASVSIAGIVTGIAWYNYTFMKDLWVQTHMSPTTYRYADWLITVPLQIVEFYFILKASGPVRGGLAMEFFGASLLMVGFGWLAEIGYFLKVVGFVGGMCMWLYIVFSVFNGEASNLAAKMTAESSRQAFAYLRLIVAVGWIIYPAGYFMSYLAMHPSDSSLATLNVVYNLADLVNKGAFGLCIWSAAQADSTGLEKSLV